jgi:hypothetical protein
MAATNTVGVVWAGFLAWMNGLVGQAGLNSPYPINAVEEGEFADDAYQIPFVGIQLIKYEAVQRHADQKVWEGTVKIRCVSFVETAGGAVAEGIAKAMLISDRIESYVAPIGTNQGFEDAEWAFTYPTDPNAGGTVIVEAVITFRVNVERASN